jgi:hypothetical protein
MTHHTDGATKKSLFIQVAWFNPSDLKEQLEHVRKEHKDRSKDDYIYNVVLDEIGNPYTLSSNLTIIAPYLPGGNLKTFDNVFVGSSYIKYQGEGSSYREGMLSSTHRWLNLRIQKDSWRRFKYQFPQLDFHFYINHEGVLNHFDIPTVRAGYGAYLLQSVRDSHDIVPNRAVLWSPAVWSGFPLTRAMEAGIRVTFRNVQKWSQRYGHYGGIKWLHLQDMMGRGRKDVTKEDVRNWYKELERAYDWDSLRVNMEMFNQTPAELQAREDWYQSEGIAVGASWELRHWYRTHKEIE